MQKMTFVPILLFLLYSRDMHGLESKFPCAQWAPVHALMRRAKQDAPFEIQIDQAASQIEIDVDNHKILVPNELNDNVESGGFTLEHSLEVLKALGAQTT